MKPVVSRSFDQEIARLERLAQKDKKMALKEVCQDFEAFFVYKLLESLRRTVPKSDFLPSAPGKEIYQSLFDQEVAKTISQSGGIGLAEALYEQLLPSVKGGK
ncbi:rod-binding protein [Thermosulfuriphilus sp.]